MSCFEHGKFAPNARAAEESRPWRRSGILVCCDGNGGVRSAEGPHQSGADIERLVDQARKQPASSAPRPVLVLPNKSELSSLLFTTESNTYLSDMVLPETLASRLTRILLEYRQQSRLRAHGLRPRRKILLIGPPGSGKTMTAAALAGDLHLPFSTILLEGIITKFLGETAARLKLVFDAISASEGVYLFDEFDALGAKRTQSNDVGEIRRVLNTFLQCWRKTTLTASLSPPRIILNFWIEPCFVDSTMCSNTDSRMET